MVLLLGLSLSANSLAMDVSSLSSHASKTSVRNSSHTEQRTIASAQTPNSCSALTAEELNSKDTSNEKKTSNDTETKVSIDPTGTILRTRLETLASEIKNFQDKIKSDTKGAFDDLIAKDVRGIAFGIEAVLHILKKDKNFEKQFSADDIENTEKSLKNLKELEDAIGQYSLSQEMRAAYQKMSQRDEGFDLFLQNKIEKAKITFLEFMITKEWITNTDAADSTGDVSPRISKIRKRFDSMKWLGRKKDHRLLVSALQNYVSSLDTKIKEELEPLIMAKKYTYHELEDGFHEWRRGLRWIPIYLLALKSHFSYQEKPQSLTPEQQQLVDKYENNKYTVLSAPTEGTTLLPPLALYTVAQAIAEIGLIKEEGEAKFDLAKLLLEYGKWGSVTVNSEEQAERIIDSVTPGSSDAKSITLEEKAHATFHKFKKGDPLPEIVSSLDSDN